MDGSAEPDPVPDEAPPAAEGIAAPDSLQPAEEPAAETGEAAREEPAADEDQAAPGAPVPDSLEGKARAGVAGKSDSELAELYETASDNLEAAGGETPNQWSILIDAIVIEASERTDFGMGAAPSGLSRGERRRRGKAIKELRQVVARRARDGG